MAYNKRKPTVDYREHVARLREKGPERVYVLRGEEEYLRERFLERLRSLCVPEGLDSFNYHRFDGPRLDVGQLRDALEALPFMGERSFCEIRGFDINKTQDYDPKAFAALLKDVPDYCTLAFVFGADYAPDGRLAPVKALVSVAVSAEFTRQGDGDMLRWIERRFAQQGKKIERQAAERLLYVSGPLMNELMPEIDKVAAYTKGETVSCREVDAVARRSPEATVFQLIDALGQREHDRAAALLGELLDQRDENPQKLLYMVSEQARRLYGARLALDTGGGREYLQQCFPEIARQDFLLRKLLQSARGWSAGQLAWAVERCARCEMQMKSGTRDETALKELLLALAMGGTDDAAD